MKIQTYNLYSDDFDQDFINNCKNAYKEILCTAFTLKEDIEIDLLFNYLEDLGEMIIFPKLKNGIILPVKNHSHQRNNIFDLESSFITKSGIRFIVNANYFLKLAENISRDDLNKLNPTLVF